MKVCVLGTNSFSGQDFVDLLLDQPHYQVIGVSRSPAAFGPFPEIQDARSFAIPLSPNGFQPRHAKPFSSCWMRSGPRQSSISPPRAKSRRAGTIPSTGTRPITSAGPAHQSFAQAELLASLSAHLFAGGVRNLLGTVREDAPSTRARLMPLPRPRPIPCCRLIASNSISPC